MTLDLAREMAELSWEIRRQIGILVNRFGEVEYVIVGDERSLLIPDLTDYPLGKRLLRGLRLVHTHMKGEPLSDDDLTDLAMLRFDLIAALQLYPADPQFALQIAFLAPPGGGKATPYTVEPSVSFSRFRLDFTDFVTNLERSLEKAVAGAREVRGGRSGASSSPSPGSPSRRRMIPSMSSRNWPGPPGSKSSTPPFKDPANSTPVT